MRSLLSSRRPDPVAAALPAAAARLKKSIMFNDLSAEIRARAAAVKLAVFDVDGVLTDGRLWYAADQRELKSFHVHDGLGLKRLRSNGVEVAIITARMSHTVTERMAELGIAHVYQGQKDKLACLHQLCEALQLTLDQVCYTGDDLPDLRAMRQCGLAIGPANAHAWLLPHLHLQTRQRGGEGAAREVCDLLLAAQNKAEAELAQWL
ncbi:3-deoxy-D-manno-octulosonate 8-phosphate phosphatase (KDO 8-P phosphatase) [Tahibacter aquaticus]|uniref:3-deoxy-D-manno-octulosonate 8-phosphate phosphatase KdsC n=2 Tax=Tahibacter aquaticus TaxID=520092 RepID=A0A4R6Z2S2_9GAMM|nr:3-deoxy-D-manno-octulosonate 8-phosphate phosphatase (KDO 8-P phosphatase) [Tahibacter aquaticus]